MNSVARFFESLTRSMRLGRQGLIGKQRTRLAEFVRQNVELTTIEKDLSQEF